MVPLNRVWRGAGAEKYSHCRMSLTEGGLVLAFDATADASGSEYSDEEKKKGSW